MKNKQVLMIIATLILLPVALYAAGTPAGTAITNVATGDYKDANGNSLPQVTSNTVSTIVSQVAGVDINPPTAALNLSANSSVSYSLQLTNTGNGDDSFSLGAIMSGTFTGTYTVEIWLDVDGNGIVDGTDSQISNSGTLTADASIDLIVVIADATPNADDLDVTITTLTGTSAFSGSVSTTSVLTTTVTAATIGVTLLSSPNAQEPGGVVTYEMCVVNTGSATSFNTVITAPIPTNTTYVTESIRIGSTDYSTSTPNTDADDGDDADFNATTLAAVTINLGNLAAGGGAVCSYYQTSVNSGVAFGTEITSGGTIAYENESQTPYPDITFGGGGGIISVSQFFDVTLGVDATAIVDPGDVVIYSLSITNSGNGSDLFNLSYTSTFLTWVLHEDIDGDGVIDAGDDVLIDSDGDGLVDVGTLISGEVTFIIAKTDIPAGSSDGDVDVTTIKAVSARDLNDPAASDVGVITVTITAPAITLVKSVSPTGDQPPGATLTYRVDISNNGSGTATDVIITDAIPVNTSYVPGSMTLSGVTKTDVADGDQGSIVGSAIVFNLPTIGPGGNVYITFEVTID